MELHTLLEKIYMNLNRRELVVPDPLQFLYRYPDVRDREVAGLIASGLAYGRVKQILLSVEKILSPMGDHPREWLMKSNNRLLNDLFGSFKHRFTTGRELISLLLGTKDAILKYGSLEECLKSFIKPEDRTVLPGLEGFSRTISGGSYLLPLPSKGSAMKRVNLYLRWMVRSDNVDPGGWSSIDPSKLIIPLDTHMFKIAGILGFTDRKASNLKTAIEITDSFRSISPEDPVKYDFSLTRLGIRDDMDIQELIQSMKKLTFTPDII